MENESECLDSNQRLGFTAHDLSHPEIHSVTAARLWHLATAILAEGLSYNSSLYYSKLKRDMCDIRDKFIFFSKIFQILFLWHSHYSSFPSFPPPAAMSDFQTAYI